MEIRRLVSLREDDTKGEHIATLRKKIARDLTSQGF